MKDKSQKNLPAKRLRHKVAPEVRYMSKQTGIKKLQNGRFRARYFAGYDNKGKRQYPARTFDTQSDAIKWRSEQVSIKNPGRCFEGHGLTVSEFIDRWLATKKQTVRENSFTMYQQSLNTYVKPAVGHIRLSRLTPSHVEAMQSDLLTRVSATTVASARMLLSGAMKKALRLGLIRTNPVDSTDGPKKEKPNRYPLTVDEALRVAEACEGVRSGLFFVLALNTGLRPEELIGLQWANVELGARGVVHVKRVIHHLAGGGWRWHEPKTSNGTRSVVFPAETAWKLAEHRKAQLEQKLKAGHYWRNNDLVFCNTLGEPFRLRRFHQDFKAVLKIAKLPQNIKLYDLRHFFVTSSLLAGVDAKTVSAEAGHAKVSFTLEHYGSVLEEMHETASDKRAELMKSRARK